MPSIVPIHLSPRGLRALVGAVSLAVAGCADHPDIRSYTYEFTEGRRVAAERGATQAMQDSCYFSGYQRFTLEGPPQIVSEDGGEAKRLRATQSFSCVGTVGGP
jgi:hypothetical protein